MSEPKARWLELPAGRFRALEWPGHEPTAIFLHGLTGVAEVWAPTITRLGGDRPRSIAIDQRSHGQSAKPTGPTGPYDIGAFVADLMAVLDVAHLERPHLIGHSMGARVAMVAAARFPERFRSVAIVDIGPEAWRANWLDSEAAFDRMPREFATLEEALGRAGRARGGESLDAALASDDELRGIAEARFERSPSGKIRWRADIEALKRTVRSHRSRNYWREWRSLSLPALLVRGGTSNEVRLAIADQMRRENPRVRYLELEGVGHNIPLIAPGRLAQALTEFWNSV